MAKNRITRKEAEAHDAEVREHVKRQRAAWEDRQTVMLALGYALPEKPLTSAAKKELEKRADSIVRSVLIKHLKGGDMEFNMRVLALHWLEQQERGRGRPLKRGIQKFLVREAVWDEYQKHPSKRPLHKQILGIVGDRLGIGMERMKQLAPRGPDPNKEIEKSIERITGKTKRK